jgi:hypothetical protein
MMKYAIMATIGFALGVAWCEFCDWMNKRYPEAKGGW